MPNLPVDTNQIVITASRAPETQAQTPASVTIIDQQLIERLDQPLATDFLRLVPSASVSTSGPAGSFTDVRIRGAEGNHTLLLIDGIRANDPATGDQPRFDLLNADIASRIEVVRGPQSALWGSDAIGGVVAINGSPENASRFAGQMEAGSFGFERANTSAASVASTISLAAAAGLQRATGIDSFNGDGDRDGYRNLSGRVRATWNPTPALQLGVAGFAIASRAEFDGFDPVTFLHADTLDNSRNRMAAGRVWAQFGSQASSWSGRLALSDLASSNRNYVDDAFVNRTSGTRRNADAQLEHRFTAGGITNRIIAAAEAEGETFHARDVIYGGATDQARTRRHSSLTLEWRSETKGFTGDVAVRRDFFNRFKDATTLRGSALVQLGGGLSLAGSYAEGIAQPTFFDLYGFFPGDFVGNPSLRPESSRGVELSVRYRRGNFGAVLTAYRQRLHDEIVDNATFTSVLNSTGTSRRAGLEATVDWQLGKPLRIFANYAYLKATQPDQITGRQTRETRRPKHSASVVMDGVTGRFTYGASLAYVGRRYDNRDTYPYERVSLASYWLASARVGYAVSSTVQLFGRLSNGLNRHYEDVYGYRTEPRAAYAGIRLSRR